MKKISNGFTIVELLIVILIIGILSTIGIFSYSRVQANSRDAKRSASTAAIAEALENYYEENGEYPSCSAMTQSVDTIASDTLQGIPTSVFATPSEDPGTNSIICGDLTSNDNFAYVGDGSQACLTGQDCLEWTLKYREEATGEIVSIPSRHKTAISTLITISDLAVIYTYFNRIDLDWTSVDNAISYNLQRADNSSFTTNMVETTVTDSTASVTGLTIGKTYYFRVRPNASIGSGNWSNSIGRATLTLNTPVVMATANSTSQITIGWSAITNAQSYTIERSTSSSFTSPTQVTGYTGTAYAATGLAANTTYYFRVKSVADTFSSSWSTTASTATLHLATPVVTATTNSSTQITISWSAISMATSYSYQGSLASDFSSIAKSGTTTGTSVAITGLSQGRTYYFRVNAINSNDTSSYSSTATATTTVDAPAAPSMSSYVSGGWAYGSIGGVSCAAGTTTYYQIVYNVNDGSGTWPGWSTNMLTATGNNQGYKYGYWGYAYCQGVNAASGAAGGNSTSTVIPINTPAAPTYLSPAHFHSAVNEYVNYQGYCPGGTNTISATYHTLAWSGKAYGPHPWGYLDSWDWDHLLTSDQNVQYWASYQCQTSYYTSPMSPESYNVITVYHG